MSPAAPGIAAPAAPAAAPTLSQYRSSRARRPGTVPPSAAKSKARAGSGLTPRGFVLLDRRLRTTIRCVSIAVRA
eukprot:633423-Rhodomonas_salina.1